MWIHVVSYGTFSSWAAMQAEQRFAPRAARVDTQAIEISLHVLVGDHGPVLLACDRAEHAEYGAPMSDAVHAIHAVDPDDALDDLRRRLDAVRWPDRELVDDWSQGAPLSKVQALCAHWRNSYDWRRCEAQLNSLGQFTTELDGLRIHFIHVRSPHEHAMPLLITHGWPGSVIEFMKVIGPLTDPVAHGGRAEDAFHVIAPSLPGFGFSDKPVRDWLGCRPHRRRLDRR